MQLVASGMLSGDFIRRIVMVSNPSTVVWIHTTEQLVWFQWNQVFINVIQAFSTIKLSISLFIYSHHLRLHIIWTQLLHLLWPQNLQMYSAHRQVYQDFRPIKDRFAAFLPSLVGLDHKTGMFYQSLRCFMPRAVGCRSFISCLIDLICVYFKHQLWNTVKITKQSNIKPFQKLGKILIRK